MNPCSLNLLLEVTLRHWYLIIFYNWVRKVRLAMCPVIFGVNELLFLVLSDDPILYSVCLGLGPAIAVSL